MSFKKISQLSLMLASLVMSEQVFAWGAMGHRVTGDIAEHLLSADAKRQVAAILGVESLAEAATYPDDMRSSPEEFWQKTANPWHYVTLKQPHDYHEHDAPAQGDAMTALAKFSATVKDPNASQADKQLALRFIVHIIGDLHQPLHISDAARNDKGGNTIKLKYFGHDSNLHKVWDSEMLDGTDLSFSELSGWLRKYITADELKAWSSVDPKDWIRESSELREKSYPSSDDVSWDYNFQQLPVVKKRLQMGGVRLANYLNALFAK